MHASGVHATVAGVLLAFTVPVVRSEAAGGPEAGPGMAEHFEHRLRPISAGFAVPVFALFAAGVTVGGLTGLGEALTDPVALGIVAGLVVGKPVGIFCSTYLLSRFTRAELDDDLAWIDVFGLAVLAGIGFTVSLLIGELAFGPAEPARRPRQDRRPRRFRRRRPAGHRRPARPQPGLPAICEDEERDDDADGIPDVYQSSL